MPHLFHNRFFHYISISQLWSHSLQAFYHISIYQWQSHHHMHWFANKLKLICSHSSTEFIWFSSFISLKIILHLLFHHHFIVIKDGSILKCTLSWIWYTHLHSYFHLIFTDMLFSSFDKHMPFHHSLYITLLPIHSCFINSSLTLFTIYA